MQTFLPESLLNSEEGKRADAILRSCVHCGFCTATCPTYLVTGNELDSPRGRIYLIKEMLEKNAAGRTTQRHLDRCLTCQSCESTCPSDVQYHQLLNIGRAAMENHVPRPPMTRLYRKLLLWTFSRRRVFSALVRLGKFVRFLLPATLRRQLPGKSRFPVQGNFALAQKSSARKVVLLGGCVQQSLSPDTNLAARRVLNLLGIHASTLDREPCCGALHHHSHEQIRGTGQARHLVDACAGAIENGAEAIISTASGCGNFIKDYADLFSSEDPYSRKVKTIRPYIMDISEFLQRENLESLNIFGNARLAFHPPCTLQHGQRLGGRVEDILTRLGFSLTPVANKHLCCGSAGTYSLFHKQMADTLRRNKLNALEQEEPDRIATANIGCQCHLAAGTSMPVRHWIEEVADAIAPGSP